MIGTELRFLLGGPLGTSLVSVTMGGIKGEVGKFGLALCGGNRRGSFEGGSWLLTFLLGLLVVVLRLPGSLIQGMQVRYGNFEGEE